MKDEQEQMGTDGKMHRNNRMPKVLLPRKRPLSFYLVCNGRTDNNDLTNLSLKMQI